MSHVSNISQHLSSRVSNISHAGLAVLYPWSDSSSPLKDPAILPHQRTPTSIAMSGPSTPFIITTPLLQGYKVTRLQGYKVTYFEMALLQLSALAAAASAAYRPSQPCAHGPAIARQALFLRAGARLEA